MLSHWVRSLKTINFTILVLALLFTVACGSAAPPTPTQAPATQEERRPAPIAQREATPVSATAQPTATPAPVGKSQEVTPRQVTRLRYAIGAVDNETNRPWAGSRQSYVQYDPMLNNLVGIDPETSEFIPELATSWEASDDLSQWTFHLREGVPFHNDWGEFTAKDVKHTLSILLRDDARLSTGRFFSGQGEAAGASIDQIIEIVDDHTVKFTMHGSDGKPVTTADMLFFVSNGSSEMAPWSKDFWDAEGLDGLDKKGLQGTGSYQYLDRKLGQSIILEKAPQPHWRGDEPDFQEIEILWVIEDASRYAALQAGEVYLADLPLDLQKDAESQGFKLIRSRFSANNLFVFFGGMWFSDNPEDKAKFDPTVPWTDIKVRKAMNLAVNREELLQELYGGFGELMYVGYYHPTHYGYDPTWEERYGTMYKYNPEEAKRLLAEAGYGPDNPVRVTAMSYVSPGESELPQVMEAICVYWEEVNIQCKLEDLDGATVAQRYQNRESAHQVWPNIIIYFPLEYGVTNLLSSYGTSHPFSDNYLDKITEEWRHTTDPKERDRIAREVGNYNFDNYTMMPLFWFPHTIVADPAVVSDWVYPGNAVPRASHIDSVVAAAK
jgi:peptide/nickel transport system substrate-binding protein